MRPGPPFRHAGHDTAFNPRIPRDATAFARFSLIFTTSLIHASHMRCDCSRIYEQYLTFNPRIPRRMRQQFCTNNNIICWYKLLNINNNLSTGYYYLANLMLSKTIYTLFFRCESPGEIMFTLYSHISNYPRIHVGCDMIMGNFAFACDPLIHASTRDATFVVILTGRMMYAPLIHASAGDATA